MKYRASNVIELTFFVGFMAPSPGSRMPEVADTSAETSANILHQNWKYHSSCFMPSMMFVCDSSLDTVPESVIRRHVNVGVIIRSASCSAKEIVDHCTFRFQYIAASDEVRRGM
jgi:hypothetical protein